MRGWSIIASGIYRLLGGYKPERKREPQTNEVHRCSVDFDGSTEYLRLAALTTIGIANAWSISFWCNPEGSTFTANSMIVAFRDNAANNDDIELEVRGAEADDPYRVFIIDQDGHLNGYKSYEYDNFFTSGQWAHVVTTWDGTDIVVYKNGVPITVSNKAQDDAMTMGTRTRSSAIGAGAHDGSGPFDGKIHSVGVWSSVLTASEVEEIYNAGCGADYDLTLDQNDYASSGDLVHWWRCGKDPSDIGGDYGNAGTLIDLDTDAANISTADIVSNAPEGAYVDLDGANEYLGNQNPGTTGIANTYSWGVWARWPSFQGANEIIIDLDDDDDPDKKRAVIYIQADNKLYARVLGAGDGSDAGVGATNALIADQWYHVMMVKDGTSAIHLYVNGVLEGSDTSSIPDTSSDDSDRDFSIGAAANVFGNDKSNMQLHSAFAWDVALDAANVKALFNGGHKNLDLSVRGGNYTKEGNLIHWWRCRPPGTVGTGTTYMVDQVASGGIDVETNAANIAGADFIPAAGTAVGVSIDFNGSDENMANTTNQSIGIVNAWTINAWIYPHDVDTARNDVFAITENTPTTPDRIQCLIRGDVANDPVQVVVYDNGGSNLKNYYWNAPLTENAWNMVTISWDGTNLLLYVNGISEGAADTKNNDDAVTTADSNRSVYLADYPPTAGAEGDMLIHSVAIWSEVLSAGDLMAIFSRASSADLRESFGVYTASDTLQHWWKPGEDGDDLGKDYGNGSNLIDIDTNASNIDYTDVVGDAP
jgi:hypothetical protein